MAKTNGNGSKQAPTTPARKDPNSKEGKAELKGLFATFEKADQELRVLEQSMSALVQKRSDAVRAIGEYGNGPYQYKGKLLTVTSRMNEEAFKAQQAPENDAEAVKLAKARATRFFFKSTGEQTITEVA